MARAATVLLCLGLAACALVKLKGESETFYSSTALVGRVSSPASWQAPVVVAAYARRDGGIEIAHRALLHEIGAYELVAPRGEYSLFAFGDANGNLRYDDGEPAGDHAGGKPVAVSGDGVISFLDIALSRSGSAAVPPGTSFAPPSGTLRSTQAGARASLDDEAFSAETAGKGYWAPMEFFREMGGNIHFLEPYDAAKTPILFVHGAAGSPRDWRTLAAGIDRGRYQPWFFYYPSGASVQSMAYLLFWKLYNLQLRYGFRRMHVVAHSMGGLVARTFLAEHGANFPHVKLFVSISTPWGGEALADLGVRASPAVIPSWRDMQPDGQFLRTLFDRRLPPATDYFLLFGHRGGGALFRPSNDGTVTLESQLAPAAQAEARMVYGYNEDHTSILSSRQVAAQLEALLAAADAPTGASAREGRLRVVFRYAGNGGAPRAQPLLVLTPADAGAGRISLPLNPEDSDREVGPFPAGAYDASLVAYAFKTEPVAIPLVVGAGRSTTLGFRLTPQGVLSGYVTDAAETSPAGAYRAPAASVRIESVTLTGAGERRKLAPVQGDDADAVASYLNGEDYAARSFFSFVGLAAGDYELAIHASGYRPYTAAYRVVPGEYGSFKPIVLTPLP
jgi:pimeloyl-ACP methyl ester carboxylesterase